MYHAISSNANVPIRTYGPHCSYRTTTVVIIAASVHPALRKLVLLLVALQDLASVHKFAFSCTVVRALRSIRTCGTSPRVSPRVQITPSSKVQIANAHRSLHP